MNKKSPLDQAHRLARQARSAENKGEWTTAIDKHERTAHLYESILGQTDNNPANKLIHLLITEHRVKANKIRQQLGFSKVFKRAMEDQGGGKLDEESYASLVQDLQGIEGLLKHKLGEIRAGVADSLESLRVGSPGNDPMSPESNLHQPSSAPSTSNTALRNKYYSDLNISRGALYTPQDKLRSHQSPQSRENLLKTVDTLLADVRTKVADKAKAMRETLDSVKSEKKDRRGGDPTWQAQQEELTELRRTNKLYRRKIKELKKANEEWEKSFGKQHQQNQMLKQMLRKAKLATAAKPGTGTNV